MTPSRVIHQLPDGSSLVISPSLIGNGGLFDQLIVCCVIPIGSHPIRFTSAGSLLSLCHKAHSKTRTSSPPSLVEYLSGRADQHRSWFAGKKDTQDNRGTAPIRDAHLAARALCASTGLSSHRVSYEGNPETAFVAQRVLRSHQIHQAPGIMRVLQ